LGIRKWTKYLRQEVSGTGISLQAVKENMLRLKIGLIFRFQFIQAALK